MSATFDSPKSRPFSADVTRLTKVRLQTSNCPTILKHEVTSPSDGYRPFSSTTGFEKQLSLDRPLTANNSTKMKFAYLQSMRPITSPGSTMRPLSGIRPLSGAMSSTINFEFLNGITKGSKGKFQDRSRIKPVQRLKTDQFHNVIYKVKQQKESLEKEINRMEQWQRDFKENDIWNTPQTAIVDSILRLNARANPEGNVSKLLQSEKQLKAKEDDLRASRRSERPHSAYLSMKKSPSTAKSVQDFFAKDDGTEEVIEEIIGAKKYYYSQYEFNKQRITDKINSFVDNQATYNTIVQSTKANSSMGFAHAHLKSQKYSEMDQPQVFEESVEEDPQQRNPSETAENDDEHSDSTPTQALKAISSNAPGKYSLGPYHLHSPQNSAKLSISSAISPKGYENLTGIPAAIHTRPETAKYNRPSQSATLSTGYQSTGELRQQTMTNVHFMPFVMEGQKMTIEPYNLSLSKGAHNISMSSKSSVRGTAEPSKSSKSTRTLKTTLAHASIRNIQSNPNFNPENKQQRIHQRPTTAKVKATSGTQTNTPELPAVTAVGKVNINGEYFQTFSPGGAAHQQHGHLKQKKELLESWASKDSRNNTQNSRD